MSKKIESRKKSHLEISLKEKVEASVSAGFEDVIMIHRSLPEIARSDIDTSVKLFDHILGAPLILEPMTGGATEATKINRLLGKCAERYNLAVGVGSQRAAIENPRLMRTYSIVRENAPNAFIFANLGCPQFAADYGIEEAKAAVEMIQADALMIHSNPLQESIQLEGEPDFRGVLSRLTELTSALKVPVVIKETGSGISGEVASQIERAGAKGIDVAGTGGTSWAAVEYFRAIKSARVVQQALGRTFRDWGIPTCVSIVETSRSTNMTVIASGGLRSGLDIAKSIALGATAGGLALPILKAASHGNRHLDKTVETLIEELRTTMFLVGARRIDELRKVSLILSGRTAHWLNERGYATSDYARRTQLAN